MNEPNNPNPSPVGGSKLSTIFLVVLGLHIVLIVAFSAYHLLKGGSSSESAANSPVAEAGTTPSASESSDPTGAAEQPTVETQHADATTPNAETPASDASALPMPASNDPIWTRVPAPSENREAAPARVPAPSPSVATPAPRMETAATQKSHTVAKGESLAKIARTHGVSVAELKSANSMTGDLIKIGQVLQVPSTASARPSPASVASAKPAPAAVPVVKRAVAVGSSYTVGKGDTLWKIAQKFNVKPQQLAEANGITDPSKLKVGMVLRLPGVPEKQDMAKPPVNPEPVPVNADMAMVPR